MESAIWVFMLRLQMPLFSPLVSQSSKSGTCPHKSRRGSAAVHVCSILAQLDEPWCRLTCLVPGDLS